MKRVQIGNLESVSNICFGTMYFGTRVEQQLSFQLLDHYMDKGGNFIDTSNNYAFWEENGIGDESEEVLGKWIKQSGQRDNIVLATKVGARPRTNHGGIKDMEGLSYETIISGVEGSLKRLNTDYIDLYYTHVDWYEYPLEERLKAFDKLVKDGKVRELGVSNLYPWRLERMNNLCELSGFHKCKAVQLKHSFLRPKYNADFWVQKQITDEWTDFMRQNPDQMLIAYSPLLSGVFAGKRLPEEYRTTDNEIRMKTLHLAAEELNLTMNQLVLAWMLHSEPKIIPLIAASKVEQLSENLVAWDVSISKEIIDKLNGSGD